MSILNKTFDLGKFNKTSLRLLQGTLQALHEVQSNGYGGGNTNHCYKLVLEESAWILVVKGGKNPTYYSVTPLDGNTVPIEARYILQSDTLDPKAFDDQISYALSDTYNTFDPLRIDKNNELYLALKPGVYYLIVFNTRNEPLDYEIGVIVETKETFGFIQTEESEGELFVIENSIDDGSTNSLIVVSPISSDETIGPTQNAFSSELAEIISGVTVTVSDSLNKGITWLIDETPDPADQSFILLDAPDLYFEGIRDRSLSAWKQAWVAEFTSSVPFPELFVPLANRP
ncbi:MAG: hypothetical protein Tp158DCM1229571_62 [Prokaryotic dsDNA virus sp.]|nr:MAG: hypothetical protein Tp158DCM1229571_62 [Prokaryotic dsDNA virus sp.]|tara:strand:+ start:33780 stop:34640 length:861 start_codon:yes stop_codon:yes gene_type:complete